MIAAVVGAGPAGLMAAEVLAVAGVAVTVFDRMPSPGRKLLMAGRGGLNLTHSEPQAALLGRYGPAQGWVGPAVDGFTPRDLVAWCEALGQPTFVGSSGRIFPRAMKASPLLRAWLARLSGLGVRMAMRRRWDGWGADGALRFDGGATTLRADAVVLALGGASWPRLGSDGRWPNLLPEVAVAPLVPANCGFTVDWSQQFRARFAGVALKRLAVAHGERTVRGEAMVTEAGIEGGVIYALSAALRSAVATDGAARIGIDLRPDLDHAALGRAMGSDRGSQSLSTYLRKAAGLAPVAVGLVQEALHDGQPHGDLVALIKAVPLRLLAPFALDRAISTAGGVTAGALDGRFMLRACPGVFAAGEMLDWEAPTGGYLLQGAFSTGHAAGHGALAWLRERSA